MKILLTGATGYIGGRLVPKLLEQGHEVRVLVRDPNRIAGRPWTSRVQIFTGDLVQNKGLVPALDGVDAAYYLVHSMLSGPDFQNLDHKAAENFAAAAKHVKHVIYLGGLVPKAGAISEHLKSRAEVGDILRKALPTTEFRAGPIIGSGSASFEMLRYLTERLPIMIAPRWIKNEIQPLAVRDVLGYLVAALNVAPSGVIDVGADRLTFKKMMQVFAEVRGLRRTILPVPVFAPGLASRWVGLVTPIPNSIAVPIIEGIIQPLIADTAQAERLFPDIKPIPYRKAVELSLARLQSGGTETRWSNALGQDSNASYLVKNEEGMIREVRRLKVNASPESLFKVFSQLGGEKGWLAWRW
ncbi:MAG TPA: NAD(P)H-binding protein, partial [Oligoflexia bacterium]|nr:NAD(P)H-binding protein [Oligoflexia bacterium]